MKLKENNSVNFTPNNKAAVSSVALSLIIAFERQQFKSSVDYKSHLQLGVLTEVCKLVIHQQHVVKEVQSLMEN